MVVAARRIPWALVLLLFWAAGTRECLAGGNAKVTGGIEPAYTACLSSGSTCINLVRTQFRLQYKPISVRKFSLRFRLLRAYQLTFLNDNDVGAGEEQQASRFDPPFDVADAKMRFSEADGRDHLEVSLGYAYQHSDPDAVDGYHTGYISGDYYFGPPIRTGWGGLSRRFDFLLRVSGNQYATIKRSYEEFGQFVPTYTFPLNNDGSTRMYASYAREMRFAGSNAQRTPSNRFELGVYRDPARWYKLYGRLAIFGTRGVPGVSRIVLGVDITI